MIIGQVCGTLHSTINHPFYDQQRILVVDCLQPDGSKSGKYLVAIDTVDSGLGDTVLIIDEGNSARQIVQDSLAPVRTVIVGIVDEIYLPDGVE